MQIRTTQNPGKQALPVFLERWGRAVHPRVGNRFGHDWHSVIRRARIPVKSILRPDYRRKRDQRLSSR